jgi:hopanoid C-3 methylase
VHECTGGGEHQHQHYPGTETWITEQRRLQTRDYRLFDIQHAVLPTKLPLATFYRELLHTQRVLYRKHMTWWTAPMFAGVLARNLVRGQTISCVES